MTAKEKISDHLMDEEVLLLDDNLFVDSLVGIVMLPGPRAVYNYNLMVEELVKKKGMSYEDATDYVSYNEVRGCGYMGDKAPIIFDPLE